MTKEYEVEFRLNNNTEATKDWDGTLTEVYVAEDFGEVVLAAETYVRGYNQAAADFSEGPETFFQDVVKLHSITALDIPFEEED